MINLQNTRMPTTSPPTPKKIAPYTKEHPKLAICELGVMMAMELEISP